MSDRGRDGRDFKIAERQAWEDDRLIDEATYYCFNCCKWVVPVDESNGNQIELRIYVRVMYLLRVLCDEEE